MGFVMKIKGILALSLLLGLGFAGCKTKTVYIPVKQTTLETVTYRDTIIDTQLAYYRDTVVTPDTISFLSNPYGFSWAEARDGKLHHSLTSWPDSLISVRTRYIERVIVDSIPAPYPVEVPVYKERELSFWQKVRIRIGEISGFVLGVCLLVWFVRRRK